MDPQDVVDIGRQAIWICLLVSAPVLIVGMVVGLGVGLLQALTQIQEIVIITAHLASLYANTCVLERAAGWQRLGKKPELYLPRDFQFLGSAAFGFQLFRCLSPLCFQGMTHLVEAHQGKYIPIDILEAGEHATPNR